MDIFKHVEYKLVCDKCTSDLTDYIPAKNQKDALPHLVSQAKKEGAVKKGNNWFCNESCAELHQQ